MAPIPPLGVRIGELSRRVGVPAETLRAWERRYGVLRPRRTDKGYRVYGGDDEARAQRMRELIEGGWAASQAAVAVARSPGPGTRPTTAAPAGSEAVQELVDALLRLDSRAAHAALDRILAARSLDSALRDVVLPAMHEVGDGWALGDVTVGQEHFATELVTGRLRGLARDWDDGLGPRAVLACPSGERHDLGLLCCGLALHRRGWRVTYLGPDTPAAALASTVGLVVPALVVVGAVRPEPLREAAAALAEVAKHVRVAVGGAGATPRLAAAAGALHLATDPVTAAGRLTDAA